MASVRRERSPPLRSSWPTCRSRVSDVVVAERALGRQGTGDADRAPAQQAVVAAHQAEHQLAGRVVGHLAQQAERRGHALDVGVHHEATDAAGHVAAALRVGEQGDRRLVPAQEGHPARAGQLVDELVAHAGPGGGVEVDPLVEAEVTGQLQPVSARGTPGLDELEELVEVGHGGTAEGVGRSRLAGRAEQHPVRREQGALRLPDRRLVRREVAVADRLAARLPAAHPRTVERDAVLAHPADELGAGHATGDGGEEATRGQQPSQPAGAVDRRRAGSGAGRRAAAADVRADAARSWLSGRLAKLSSVRVLTSAQAPFPFVATCSRSHNNSSYLAATGHDALRARHIWVSAPFRAIGSRGRIHRPHV